MMLMSSLEKESAGPIQCQAPHGRLLRPTLDKTVGGFVNWRSISPPYPINQSLPLYPQFYDQYSPDSA